MNPYEVCFLTARALLSFKFDMSGTPYPFARCMLSVLKPKAEP